MQHKPGSHNNKAIFLDRDGVLNKVVLKDGIPHPPQTIEEFEILPMVKEALTDLKSANYMLVVVTNQPDVARGNQSLKVVDEMHRLLLEALPLDLVKVCIHQDKDLCQCRKPKPGMLLQAAEELGIDLKSSYMIGDRWRDIDAGLAAGCKTVWIVNTYSEKHPTNFHHSAKSLWLAAKNIIRKS